MIVVVNVKKAINIHIQIQWQIQGRGPGGAAPPLFLDQIEAQRAEKNYLGHSPLRI